MLPPPEHLMVSKDALMQVMQGLDAWAEQQEQQLPGSQEEEGVSAPPPARPRPRHAL